MKKIFSLSILMLGIAIVAFSQTDYKMWEGMYITAKTGQEDALKKGLTEHNKKYHPQGLYQVNVYSIEAGKHEGDLFWAMGPCTFTDLDSRPETDEHDQDWAKNVAPYVEKSGEVNYWKLNDKVSYDPANAPGGKVVWSTYDIKPFQNYRFIEMLKTVVEVYKQKNYPNAMYVFESQFDFGNGEDILIEWSFDKWAYFDKNNEFVKDYEAVHGEGIWNQFMEEYRGVVEKGVDQLVEYVPEASSPQK